MAGLHAVVADVKPKLNDRRFFRLCLRCGKQFESIQDRDDHMTSACPAASHVFVSRLFVSEFHCHFCADVYENYRQLARHLRAGCKHVVPLRKQNSAQEPPAPLPIAKNTIDLSDQESKPAAPRPSSLLLPPPPAPLSTPTTLLPLAAERQEIRPRQSVAVSLFICQKCNFTSVFRNCFDRHTHNENGAITGFPCANCDHVSPTWDGMQLHIALQHNPAQKFDYNNGHFECRLCPYNSTDSDAFFAHYSLHKEKTPRSYIF